MIQAGALRWRGTVVALLGSLLASLACLGPLNTLVRQAQLMVPHAGTKAEQEAVRAAHAAWQSDRRIGNPIAQFNVLAKRSPSDQELANWASDPENTVAVWAELLVRLREAGVEPARRASSQPSEAAFLALDDAAIARLLGKFEYAPPLRLGVARLHDVFMATARYRGISARRAEMLFWSDRWNNVLAAYRPVLRELNGRLLALGHQYQRAGRSAEAARVYGASIRLLTDAVADSPVPEVALLAAAELEPATRALAGEKADAAPAAAEALDRFQRAWLDVPDRELALLPCTFGPVITGEAHGRTLSALTAAAALLGFGWVFAVICLMLLAVVVATRPYGRVPLVWRWGGWGAVVAPAMVALPLVGLALLAASDAMPFLWLASGRSLRPIVLLPALLIWLWMLASHLCLQPTDTHRQAVLPWSALIGGVGLVLVALLVSLLVPMPQESWRPPTNIQFFRRAGTLAGLLAAAVAVGWIPWGWRRRHRAGLPAGVWARGGLAVAGGAMLPLMIAAAIALAVNHGRDRVHEEAFAQAISDPVAARLGPDWQKSYFAPARMLLER